MALLVHNETASIINLARMVVGSIDESHEATPVQNGTLRLICEALIDLAEPKAVSDARDKQAKNVRDLVTPLETAIRNRDEDDSQARGGGTPKRRAAWG